MTLHRVHGTNCYYGNVYVWENEVGEGKFVGMINGKNMASSTKDYQFCVSAAPHTILLEQSSTAAWGTDSYVEIQIGGVTIAKGFVDRLGIDRFEVYRMLFVIVFYY